MPTVRAPGSLIGYPNVSKLRIGIIVMSLTVCTYWSVAFSDQSQTAARPPARSSPQSERRSEPSHKAPPASSPALCRRRHRASSCRIFTPAQPTGSAASLALTKADVAELRLELHTFRTESEANFRAVHTELGGINRRLDLIEQNHANLKGVTKEIGSAQRRAIQKHLGIERKIAA
jgi:hypothetical protein